MDLFWLAVMSPIVLGVFAGMLPTYLSHRRKEMLLKHLHSERMAAIEKGLPLPELAGITLDSIDTPNAAGSLRGGIALILVGLVLYVATARFIDEDMALFGLVPAAVGVANLVYAAILWRRARVAP